MTDQGEAIITRDSFLRALHGKPSWALRNTGQLSVLNGRKRQLRGKTRCPFQSTGLFSLLPHLHFHQCFGAQIQVLMQIPRMLLTQHLHRQKGANMQVILLMQLCLFIRGSASFCNADTMTLQGLCNATRY